MISRPDIVEKLTEVLDPELGINIVDLGLVYDIVVTQDTVRILLSLTYPGCPLGPTIIDDIKKRLQSIEGAQKVEVDIVWEPAWQQTMMQPDTLEEMQFLGKVR